MDYYGNERRELLKYFPERLECVLEVGCASGRFGALLKSEKKISRVYGIEPVAHAAKEAKKVLDNVIVGDVEQLKLPYKKAQFDGIVFADVLEHLRDPVEVLKKLLPYLKPKGIITMSIPNVHYYGVVVNLINGFWDYKDSGILDKTHLRFFTLNSMLKMIDEACLEPVFYEALNSADGSQLPVNEHNEIVMGENNKITIKLSGKEEYHDYLTYQYIIMAARKGDFDLEKAGN